MGFDALWVLAEPSETGFTSTSLELLTKAAELSPSVTAITWGAGGDDLADVAGRYGATSLIHLGDLGSVLPAGPVAETLATLLASTTATALLTPGSYDGRDIAGRLSARLQRPVLTNVTGLRDDNGLVTEHPLFGGTEIATARVTTPGVAIVVVRPKSFAAAEGSTPPAALRREAPVNTQRNATITASYREERNGPALEDAAIVVSGGRGLGSAEAFASVAEVATLLGGAPGASRAIVDAGWVPYSYQVGQTGKTVKPTVYIACGISGATQHLVGMKGSQHIVAINKDPDAPIFSIADFGVVGDVTSVLPALAAALRARG